MALISCGECGREVSDKAAACPHCGAPVGSSEAVTSRSASEAQPKKTSRWRWVIGVPVGAFILLMIIGSCADTPEARERQSSREAIDFCWSEQAKKSNSSGASRFIAGACEKMEDDYLRKWGHRP
ncbi:zinc-ribbon domain-containing protein [Comamonas antarctica]|uniref:zinc-ribbon domain-containing protein n=1 Tax=Comamonas antarctica TaxID=2743470 RepID=UPI0028E40BB2|nr:zinc-ribbon domain-containing protein [Comamonas antarctica]